MSDGKRHFFGNKKIFFLKGRQLRAVEIILLWVVTTARTCTGMFCGNCQHAGVAEPASLLAHVRCPLHSCRLYSVVACFQLAVSANLHLNVLCRMSTPTANMNPDYPDCKHGSRVCSGAQVSWQVVYEDRRTKRLLHFRHHSFRCRAAPTPSDIV